MPSVTFLNLPAEKQEKLLEAATREFSSRPYNEASINQIIKDAGIPRGSFYMYFQDKEDLFRYLMSGYLDQLMLVIEECLVRAGGDIFQALLDLFDYIQLRGKACQMGEMGAMTAIIGRNHGLQKGSVMAMLEPDTILSRLSGLVDPERLDLRQERDLRDILTALLAMTGPMIYAALQNNNAPEVRAQLENLLAIFQRGMTREKGGALEAVQTEKEE